jgi:hypothetical protein
LAKLKEHDIEIPLVPVVAVLEDLPIEESIHKGPDKLDVMTKNCNELKNNLAQLQSQLTQLQSNDPSGTVAPPEVKKSKHKNKKGKAKEVAEVDVTTVPTEEPLELTPEVVEPAAKEPLSLEATTCSAQIVEIIDEDEPKTNGELKEDETIITAEVAPIEVETTKITTAPHTDATDISSPPEPVIVAEK